MKTREYDFDHTVSDDLARIVHEQVQSLIEGYPVHPKLMTWMSARSTRIQAQAREEHALGVLRRAYNVK